LAAVTAGPASAPVIADKTEEVVAASVPSSVPAPRAPMVSDPNVAAVAAAMAARLPSMIDADQSIEIPPPAELVERTPGAASDPYIGTTFDGRYKIEKLLGEGGMGFVYLARHKVIDKKVAVKVLRAEMAKDREIVDRFLQEAKAASSIGNPHIVDISDFGDLPDGSTYFVMEYLEGESISRFCDDDDRLTVERICHIGEQMAEGLGAAHQRGIVHRDLKPDNIFTITRGNDTDFVKILDFGIAKVSGTGDTKLTKAGQVFGTPHYMSPEQAAGSTIDHRADIYALGVILYELASGQLPFTADNFMGILTQHMYKAPVPPRALVPAPDCPPALEAVILKCLSKKPELRYQSMEELGADLKRVQSGGVPHAVAEMMGRSGGFNVPHDFFKPSAIVPATPAEKRKPWPTIVWAAGAVAAVGIVIGIFAITGATKAQPVATAAPTVAAPTVTQAAAPPTATAAPAPKKLSVALGATPKTAKAYRDGAALELPAVIEVEDGKTVAIEIKADGFEPMKLELDGHDASKQVDLKPIAPKGKLPATGSGAKPCKKGGAGDIVNPWGCK
jgi:serine/threonine-protein kinase